MMIFNNLGHAFKNATSSLPIVWVDSSDTSSYVLQPSSDLGSDLILPTTYSSGIGLWYGDVFWSNLSQTMVMSGSSFESSTGSVPVDFIIGNTYKLTYTISNMSDIPSGSAKDIGNINISVGTHTYDFICTSLDDFFIGLFNIRPYSVSFSSISIKMYIPNVTTLDNKGTLGGAMTLNGNVKFDNGGFESWSNADYITRDLGEPFLPTNSFTIVTTFDLEDITSGSNSSLNWFSSLNADTNNRINVTRQSSIMYNGLVKSGNVQSYGISYSLGMQTLIASYNLDTNEMILLNYDSSSVVRVNVQFNNINNAIQYLLKSGSFNHNSGQNNPLHEFRLYDIAFSLTEMQDLQTELNNKYTP